MFYLPVPGGVSGWGFRGGGRAKIRAGCHVARSASWHLGNLTPFAELTGSGFYKEEDCAGFGWRGPLVLAVTANSEDEGFMEKSLEAFWRAWHSWISWVYWLPGFGILRRARHCM